MSEERISGSYEDPEDVQRQRWRDGNSLLAELNELLRAEATP